MPGTHSFGEVTFSLADLLVCAYNITLDQFQGEVVALADGQMLKVEPEADTDRQRGYGAIVRTLAVPIGAKLTLGMGGIHVASYLIMTGAETNTSDTTPNQVRTLDDNAGATAALPYFGVIGLGITDDGGYAAIGMKACKLDKQPDYTLDGTANKFNISETAGYAVPISNKLFRRKFYETTTLWTAPANATQFGQFFSVPAL